jgi:hypothetical protein
MLGRTGPDGLQQPNGKFMEYLGGEERARPTFSGGAELYVSR